MSLSLLSRYLHVYDLYNAVALKLSAWQIFYQAHKPSYMSFLVYFVNMHTTLLVWVCFCTCNEKPFSSANFCIVVLFYYSTILYRVWWLDWIITCKFAYSMWTIAYHHSAFIYLLGAFCTMWIFRMWYFHCNVWREKENAF